LAPSAIAAFGPELADWLDETARDAEPLGVINARAIEAARAINAAEGVR
jgi:hypothetical protein